MENDKFRNKEGRKASQSESDSAFLNGEGLQDDLIKKNRGSKDDKDIVTTDHPENQEWHAREKQNEDRPASDASRS